MDPVKDEAGGVGFPGGPVKRLADEKAGGIGLVGSDLLGGVGVTRISGD